MHTSKYVGVKDKRSLCYHHDRRYDRTTDLMVTALKAVHVRAILAKSVSLFCIYSSWWYFGNGDVEDTALSEGGDGEVLVSRDRCSSAFGGGDAWSQLPNYWTSHVEAQMTNTSRPWCSPMNLPAQLLCSGTSMPADRGVSHTLTS
jgi:hypothetical protein